MKVIGHEHIRVQRTTEPLRKLGKVIEEEAIVFLGKKTGLPVVSALDYVYRQSGS
jgi:hypothetical protein